MLYHTESFSMKVKVSKPKQENQIAERNNNSVNSFYNLTVKLFNFVCDFLDIYL